MEIEKFSISLHEAVELFFKNTEKLLIGTGININILLGYNNQSF